MCDAAIARTSVCLVSSRGALFVCVLCFRSRWVRGAVKVGHSSLWVWTAVDAMPLLKCMAAVRLRLIPHLRPVCLCP